MKAAHIILRFVVALRTDTSRRLVSSRNYGRGMLCPNEYSASHNSWDSFISNLIFPVTPKLVSNRRETFQQRRQTRCSTKELLYLYQDPSLSNARCPISLSLWELRSAASKVYAHQSHSQFRCHYRSVSHAPSHCGFNLLCGQNGKPKTPKLVSHPQLLWPLDGMYL